MHKSTICVSKKIPKAIEFENQSSCLLLYDFFKGEQLDHDSKFAIITNLKQIKGGQKSFLEVIRNSCGEESFVKWQRDIKYMLFYNPMRCSEKFCPYYDKCDQYGTMVDTIS